MDAFSPSSTAQPSQPGRSILLFAATTLLGAFLVFQVQPVISKCVLPWFGGTPTVWTTCMLFFQLVLFAGYLYAHLLRTLFSPAVQAGIHIALLAAATLLLPIEPSQTWKPTGAENPTTYLLSLLAAHVGMPYFVLSSTGPLLQAWLSYREAGNRIYRLYALSNAGSLFALLSYPFLVEPIFSVSSQSTIWSMLFCAFVLFQGLVAVPLFRTQDVRRDPTTDKAECDSQAAMAPIIWQRRAAWIGLPTLASGMLLIVTTHVCQDIAVVPFLWVLPLSIYLLSFIICFDSPQWYVPKPTAVITLAAIAALKLTEWLSSGFQLSILLASYMTLLMGVCLLCHGETARLKPQANRLTQYYAYLSAGGALGGIIVAVLCPMLFSTFVELPFALILATILSAVLLFACRNWRQADYDWDNALKWRHAFGFLFLCGLTAMVANRDSQAIASERNFFGALRVLNFDKGLCLVHGSTVHGMQRRGDMAAEPTTYYGRSSGIGLAIGELQRDQPILRIGVVGLGCGVITSYGRPNDVFDIFEINPAVLSIANKYFTFLSDCPSTVRHHLGDGRLLLERLTDRQFDLLVLDAFSSDAIPAHLLTREAMHLFQQRLAPGGLIAIHVSNKHLDLAPLVHRLSAEAGLSSRVVCSQDKLEDSLLGAEWVLITTQHNSFWEAPALSVAESPTSEELANAPLWTDQHHNLVSVLKIL